MDSLISNLAAWLDRQQPLLQQLGVASLIMLVATLVVLPAVVVNLPRDYFTRDHREAARLTRRHPLVWGALTLAKNLLGLILIVAGIAMLVLPGQGTLTILIGVALTNFPGKYELERRIVAQPAVGKALNKIRIVAGRVPLSLPDPHDHTGRET